MAHPHSEPELPFTKSPKLRLNFARKVFGIFASQAFATSLLVAAAQLSLSLRAFMDAQSFLAPLAIITSLITLYSLACYPKLQRTVPTNYVLLAIFTVSEAYAIAYLARNYPASIVVVAAILTFTLGAALLIYALFSKKDFTTMGASMTLALILLIVASIIAVLINLPFFTLMVTVFSVFLFGLYLIMDVQLIMGRHTLSFGQDDYIMAALNLYLDIINIFLNILSILGSLK